jgi:hypothetical protein
VPVVKPRRQNDNAHDPDAHQRAANDSSPCECWMSFAHGLFKVDVQQHALKRCHLSIQLKDVPCLTRMATNWPSTSISSIICAMRTRIAFERSEVSFSVMVNRSAANGYYPLRTDDGLSGNMNL